MAGELVRPLRSVMWELRSAWATGRRVSLSLDQRCAERRLEGHLSRVAATDAYVVLAGAHIPGDVILAVHVPSRLGDSSIEDGQRWFGRARRVVPQVEELAL